MLELLNVLKLLEPSAQKPHRSLSPFVVLLASATVSVLQSFLLTQSVSVAAINPGDLVCYMQTSDGRLLNLNKLCGSAQSATLLSTTDQRFLDRYGSLLRRRATGLPTVQAALLQAQQNPQAVLQRAQAVCTALRSGQPQPDSGQVGDDLVTTMAPKYYCPDLED